MKLIVFLWILFYLLPIPVISQFRVDPYLLPADNGQLLISWFSELGEEGRLQYWNMIEKDTTVVFSRPQLLTELSYSELEESERVDFPDMFVNENWKHQLYTESLSPGRKYSYVVIQGRDTFYSHFQAPPLPGQRKPIRIVALADTETDPAGRTIFRKWEPGFQTDESSGRPEGVLNYFLTESEGLQYNVHEVTEENPDLILLPGDLVQGGGYQRAWDEFFFHFSGKFGHPISTIPLLPAIGNWENYGGQNGGYNPLAVQKSRSKYSSYFTMPENNKSNYRNFYYRVDYGPVTIITLDSSNGLPDSTDFDTNININLSDYPGDDLPDINPGSDQWNWAIEQLREARDLGQIIIVQFHHIPYSSGGHSLPLTAENSSGQAGIPMRVYTPEFKKYGVVAVICGHNESLEHSVVDGIHFWDVGIAGDGFGFSIDDKDPRRENPYRQWVAHRDARELWEGEKLISGGKHYGHLVIEIVPKENNGYKIEMIPRYIFPVTDKFGRVSSTEVRTYDNIVEFETN